MSSLNNLGGLLNAFANCTSVSHSKPFLNLVSLGVLCVVVVGSVVVSDLGGVCRCCA